MKKISSWETLLEVAHPEAVAKGWWDDMDRPIDEQVACFHSEISEAFEEYRGSRMETWYSYDGKQCDPSEASYAGDPGVKYGWSGGYLVPLKPEGFWVEIADLLVRVADTCGRYQIEATAGYCDYTVEPASRAICLLHGLTSTLCDVTVGSKSCEVSFTELVSAAVKIAEAAGVDLWPIVNEKVAFNRTRSRRHGGKVA
jgi:hypothetical protein